MDNRHYAVLAEFTRSSLGAVQLLLVANALGASRFGVYSMAFAAVLLLTPAALLGCTNWIQPYLQSSRNEQAVFTHVVICVFGTALFWAPTAALVLAPLVDASRWDIYVLLFAELGVYCGWTHLALVELGMQRGLRYFLWTAAMSLTRLLAATLLVIRESPSLHDLAELLLITGTAGLLIHLASARWRPSLSLTALRANQSRVLSFSLVSTTSTLLDQVDKVLLGRFLPGPEFGTYSAASRLNMYTLIPARGVAQAVYPRYFAMADAGDTRAVWHLMLRISALGLSTTFFLGTALIFSVFAFGDRLLPDFDGLAFMCAALLPRLLLRPFTYALGDALYAFGCGSARLASLTSVAMFYIVGLLLVAPRGSVWEIAAVGLVAEILNIALFRVSLRRARLAMKVN